MDERARSARNELFQELKPLCVELSQLALRDDGSQSSLNALTQSTTRLLQFLEANCQRNDDIFDTKLADYTFFPLSQILRRKQKYTDRLSEATVKCVKILLEYGWKTSIALDLAKQLLILLTFVIGGVPGKESAPAPEELVIVASGALAALFQDVAITPGGAASLVESGTLPALGHCVTVMLDGIVDGPSSDAQVQSLRTLDAVWNCIKEPEALASFLPGTVSALTKCLMPSTSSRRTRKVIVTALKGFENVLVSLLSDIRTRNIRNNKTSTNDSPGSSGEQKLLSPSWLKATTSQIKLALSNIIRLRSHNSVEVKSSLNRLCLTILDECHDTLQEAASMLVETCLALSDLEESVTGSSLHQDTTLLDLASIHPDIGELVKTTVFNWVTSLPRVIQASDDAAKRTALDQLSNAHKLLSGLNLESSTLEDALGYSLRDSITATLESSSSANGVEETEFDLNSQTITSLTSSGTVVTDFQPIIMAAESQKPVRDQLMLLLANTGPRETQIKMASEMLEYARGASGPSLLSAYWLAFRILKSAAVNNEDLDMFFESSLTMSDEQASVDQELFSFSLSILVDTEGDQDWRLQATALEVMADTAQRMKESFRTELVDSLYPVAQLLGSPSIKLREHAITCLNIISKSCGYKSASELIVGNVDYMVNAISLRLNTFDISPQAPQVLVMMIRLTGPSLLPYLDDVVGSIFAALDNFHGYPRLVDVLFSVLGEIVSVGSNSDQLTITDTPTISHDKIKSPPTTIDEILKLLTPRPITPVPVDHEPFPSKPWKSAKDLLDEAESLPPSEEDPDDQPQPSAGIAAPPPTKTYTMLRSITHLSQHYLTSASPHLRAKLLNLIKTSSHALHKSEDTFLPLINDIWPVVILRLYDSEPYVQIAAAETIISLCRSAGDFLSTRIQDEWPSMLKLAKQAKLNLEREKKGKGGRGVYSQASKVWEGIIGMFVGIVGYVKIGDGMFDDVLEVLGDVVERKEVREVLGVVNSDAVWLALQLRGKNKVLETPVWEGFKFAPLKIGVVS